ncbi:uncharacterized protein LOC105217171 isoform X1 [Zeugodacus cucurbitae]|uniref:uncharacterized protein LOC105217171 isoform X1 n=1 Tax=Zeugodacus cucurbitae TaxID=28588 RepID=UPI0023D94B0B|nr:uncharacterized protein LOC105217171 isoform X1 [Zeugodacus cucurbitae]XP_054088785.1 uncharacterized protein LOC105217171 isoform X1 [Zeugodacus cucurbitae]
MSFSSKVLANIKHPNDSDEDANNQSCDALLKVLKSIPENITEFDTVMDVNPRCESFKEESETCIDPLFNNVEITSQNNYTYTYQDTEILNTDESDDNENNATSHLNKRKRGQVELKGRNGFLWSTTRTNKFDNKSFQSALQLLQPKGKGPAHTISSILEMWSLLVDEQIITQIVHHTNLEIKQRKVKSPHQRLIDAVEFRAWIGLNYLCGIFRNATHNGPLDELWSLELGNAVFRATMSLKRFKFIYECLRFGENDMKAKKNNTQPIMDIWNKFLVNSRSYYAPSGNCTVDEVSINLTNSKDESQLLMLCDAKTLYMCNAMFNPKGGFRERDVLRLISDITGSRRNIVLPPKFTTIELTNKLMELDMSVLGVFPNNASELPADSAFNNTWRRLYSDPITLIISQSDTEIFLASGIPKTIKIERLYSLSCDACKAYNKARCMYSTGNAIPQNDVHIQPNFFQNILDYALLNSWILFVLSTNGDNSIKQRDFQRHLGLYLTQQQLKRQLNSNRLTLPQKVQISEVLGEPTEELFASVTAEAHKDTNFVYLPTDKMKIPDGIKLFPKNLKTRLCCRMCPSKNSRKTKTRCQQCLRPLCQKHFIQRCRDCTGVPEMETDTTADLDKSETVISDSDNEGHRNDSDP